ncbi:MAG: D-alanyl-D-alanine carboxypeptidase/D-alanyl-D-alanine-endopeptidase [Deltaproteobacteria bacterium]|nr:D-alanyl-D-alanine carboxypeptidase/D-alanyl-D-alanine-endopeptidase [Deltaproteobacteria bacterium]
MTRARPRLAAAVAILLFPALAVARPAKPASPLAPLVALERTGARVGAWFEADGREVASLHPDDLLNPASVSKVFTAAVAIERLGPDRTLETRVSLSGDGGATAIAVEGAGDPSLTGADLAALARCVKDAGVATAARVVVSGGPFDAATLPPAFDSRRTDSAYRAGVAGFQVDLNAIRVTVTPGAKGAPPSVAVAPASGYVKVVNEAVSRGKGKRKPLAVRTRVGADGRLVVHVTGSSPAKDPFVAFRRVPDPIANAGAVFLAALSQAGVAPPARFEAGAPPPGARVACTHRSKPVRDLVVPMLKDSLNPIAESLLRLAGAEGAGGPVGFAEGAAALDAFNARTVGLEPGTCAFRNGSGLYDANRVSARAIVRLLDWIRRSPSGPAVIAALPVAGLDGTMKSRLRGTALAGRVRAKTGTLDEVVSLAGWMDAVDGREVAFAVMVAAPKLDARRARKAIDESLLGIASGRASPERPHPPASGPKTPP